MRINNRLFETIRRVKFRICAKCGEDIKLKNPIIHINVAQKEKKHYFCSKKCKEEWMK